MGIRTDTKSKTHSIFIMNNSNRCWIHQLCEEQVVSKCIQYNTIFVTINIFKYLNIYLFVYVYEHRERFKELHTNCFDYFRMANTWCEKIRAKYYKKRENIQVVKTYIFFQICLNL